MVLGIAVRIRASRKRFPEFNLETGMDDESIPVYFVHFVDFIFGSRPVYSPARAMPAKDKGACAI